MLHDFRAHTYTVNAVAFSPNGQIAVSGSGDGTLKFWDVLTGSLKTSFTPGSVSSVAFSPEGHVILSGARVDGDRTGELRLWDAATGHTLLNFEGQKTPVNSVAFSPTGRSFLSGGGSNVEKAGELRLWDVATGELVRLFSGRPLEVLSEPRRQAPGFSAVKGDTELKSSFIGFSDP